MGQKSNDLPDTRSLDEGPAEASAPAPLLAERLRAHMDRLRAAGSPFAAAYDGLVAQLRAGRIGANAPAPGEAMPPFALSDQEGRFVALDDLLGRGPLIISINRGHWCPFCRIELAALSEAHEAFATEGAEVVSIMPDRQRFTQAAAAALERPFPILTDIDNDYALSLGLAMWVADPVRELMEAQPSLRIDAFQGNAAWILPLPATFILAPDGRIAARYIDPDFRERMEIADILAALRRLRR